MPRYDVRCPDHGVVEVIRLASEVGRTPFVCHCGAVSEWVPVLNAAGALIDDAENIGNERRDSTQGMNLGLPGRSIEIGRDASGKMRHRYEPIYSNTMPSNRAVREYAKANDCEPVDSGRYRSRV